MHLLAVLLFQIQIFLFDQDWAYDDGTAPPGDIVDQWFKLIKDRFQEDPSCCIAVHCVAGLGRYVMQHDYDGI